jgi:hypothetical protein
MESLTFRRNRRKPRDRENLDWDRDVLTSFGCRLTKRGDELRNVVVLKIIQRFDAWASIPLEEYC